MDFKAYSDYTQKALGAVDSDSVETVIDALAARYQTGSTVYLIGNGGSAANASHFAQDLAKGTLVSPDQEQRLRALALTDNLSFFSALANDEGYDRVFVQQLRTYAQPGDLLVAISGSGNSQNVLEAVDYAATHDITTVGVTGFDGGRLRSRVDISVHVPLDDMCTCESIHSVIFHYIVLALRERLANSN